MDLKYIHSIGIATTPSTLDEVLRMLNKEQHVMSQESLDKTISILPAPLINASCFKDSLANDTWKYHYGEELNVNHTLNVPIGAHNVQSVYDLLTMLSLSVKYLNDCQLNDFLQKKLGDKGKHANFLFEFAPLIYIDPNIKVEYETSGDKGKTIDWLINPEKSLSIRIEVKYRYKDFIEQLKNWNGNGNFPEPRHDPSILFKSCEKKFSRCPATTILQGIWIGTFLKQNSYKFKEAFDILDRDKIHFAVLSNFGRDALIVAREKWIEEYVLKITNHTASKDFFINDTQRITSSK